MSDKHYDHPVPHHDPTEGYDPTEPAAPKITFFVVGSVILLVVTIVALQQYFDSVWYGSVEERVLAAPTVELGTQRNLEDWRLSHYEYTTAAKNRVRMPVAKAREMFLKESSQGKTFYPAQPTVPKPEEPAGVAPAAGKQEDKQEDKQEGKQEK
jgi:hypothetical protein